MQFESGQGRLPKAHFWGRGDADVLQTQSGLSTRVPSSSTGWLVAPAANKGPCQDYTLQRWRRCLLCICLSSEEEREPAQVSEGLNDCPAIGEDFLGWEEAEGPECFHSSGVWTDVDPCALCSSRAAVQQSGVAKPHVALSHRGTFPIVPLFFFCHYKFYYLKGMELGNERCGKIPQTKSLISTISTLPWISFSISSSSVLGSSLGVIKVFLKL